MLLTGIGVSYTRSVDKAKPPSINQRKTIASVKDAKGIVKNIGSQDKPVYIIRYAEEYMSLVASNIPGAFKKDNLPVVFSGDMKEMSPIEDEQGQYFVVNKIVKQ